VSLALPVPFKYSTVIFTAVVRDLTVAVSSKVGAVHLGVSPTRARRAGSSTLGGRDRRPDRRPVGDRHPEWYGVSTAGSATDPVFDVSGYFAP
jgi:hypothetical protein